MDSRIQIPAFAVFLFAAILVYGLFGSPTPDNPGIVEGVIGGLLILAAGSAAFRRSFDLFSARNAYLKALQVFFVCGLVTPLLAGVYYGNDRMLMARDLAAFVFLGLPLFLSERLARDETCGRIFPLLLSLCGFLFCVRTLLPVFNIWVPAGELLYLSNSPLALFAAVFLAGSLWVRLMQFSRKSLAAAILMLAALCVLLAAMLLDVQRATVGAVFITLSVLAAFSVFATPRKALLPVLLLIAAGIAAYPLIGETLQAMAHKTSEVGLNMRAQEAMAVYDAIRHDPFSFFFGRGWGAVFSSPAVGGLEVNYTHSLLTTMALKGGAVLFLLSFIMAGTALWQIFVLFQSDKVRGLALFWPLAIPVFLYASHKSLDFGLILLLIGMWSIQGQALQKSHTSCNKAGYL